MWDAIWHAELKTDFHSLNASVHSLGYKEKLALTHMDRIAPAATAYILAVYWAIALVLDEKGFMAKPMSARKHYIMCFAEDYPITL